MGDKASVLFRTMRDAFTKKKPEILLGVALSGSLVAMVEAGLGTYSAVKLIEKKKKELGKDKLTLTETLQTVWLCYVPAGIAEAVTLGSMLGCYGTDQRTITALTAAIQLSDSRFKEYADKTVEVVGAKKEQEIRDAIARDDVAKHPVISREVFKTGNGTYLCRIWGRYFRSDINAVKEAINKMNYRMPTEFSIMKSELLWELGLVPDEEDDKYIWHMDHGLIDPRFSYVSADDGEPCMVISFYNEPTMDA